MEQTISQSSHLRSGHDQNGTAICHSSEEGCSKVFQKLIGSMVKKINNGRKRERERDFFRKLI
jgi:hypothetical protein